MAATLRLRDAFKSVSPWWLSDRPTAGKTVGYRFLWSMISVLDVLAEGLLQGMRAAWPGAGTPTALPYIGRSRGIARGQSDTDDEYAAKLRAWLVRWEDAGSMEGLARELHEYLGNHPRVRIVNRAGRWVTMENGVLGTTDAEWNWDGVSHPERAGFWSELWIIIYPTQWAVRGSMATLTPQDGYGLGHLVSREEVDAVKGIVSDWKSAHSRVRAVIWTSDATLFDPDDSDSLPDGTWGAWGGVGSGSRTASGRNTTTCRYWEL